jgi:hypothetical protein
LYSNLSSLSLDGKDVDFLARLKLTGNNIRGKLTVPFNIKELSYFIVNNQENFSQKEKSS